MSKIIVAGDPGASGAIAWRDPETAQVMTMTWKKIVDGKFGIVERLSQGVDSKVIYVEKVSGYIGKEQTGSSMFSFGEVYGAMWAPFMAYGFTVKPAEPKKWQKSLFITKPKGCSYETGKRILKNRAIKMYPEVKVTLTNADALLILKYAEICEPAMDLFPAGR